MVSKSNIPPLLPKPKKFWSVVNRYYEDGEAVKFSIMRGGGPRLEGEGKVVSATINEYGRIGYKVNPKDKAILKRASSHEQKDKLLHANLEDLEGGPWRSGEGHQLGGTVSPSDKLFHFNISTDDKGNQTLSRNIVGLSDMELLGWLRVVSREMEVRLITAWASDPNYCSFCGNHENIEALLLSGGRNARICKSCVEQGYKLITKEAKPSE